MNETNPKQQSYTKRTSDITVKSGNTTCLLNYHFSEKGKQTMNDKVFKLILTDYSQENQQCALIEDATIVWKDNMFYIIDMQVNILY